MLATMRICTSLLLLISAVEGAFSLSIYQRRETTSKQALSQIGSITTIVGAASVKFSRETQDDYALGSTGQLEPPMWIPPVNAEIIVDIEDAIQYPQSGQGEIDTGVRAFQVSAMDGLFMRYEFIDEGELLEFRVDTDSRVSVKSNKEVNRESRLINIAVSLRQKGWRIAKIDDHLRGLSP